MIGPISFIGIIVLIGIFLTSNPIQSWKGKNHKYIFVPSTYLFHFEWWSQQENGNACSSVIFTCVWE